MPPRKSTNQPPGARVRSTTQVLIVDDEPEIRGALGELLEDAGFSVAAAADGARALEWMRANPGNPGVVLLDMMMPVMDGITFLQHREQAPALRAIPVVVFTADALAGQRALQSGRVEAVLRKPLNWQELIDLLQDRLGLVPAGRERQAR